MEFVGVLVLILVLTTLAGHFAQRMGVPAVVGQLLVGVILGTGGLNLVHSNELVQTFSEIGVIILMFLAGMESDLRLLRKYLKPSLFVAILGVISPVLFVGSAALLLHLSLLESLFIGVIFSATSVSISVVVLKEYQTLDSKEGITILGAAVIDDVLGVLLLSMMVLLTEGSSSSLTQQIVKIVAGPLVFFGLVYLIVRWVAPYLMRLTDQLYITNSKPIMSLIICLGMAWVAEEIGLSAAIGAFFAGIAVSATDSENEITESIEPIGYAMFIPVFFVSVGLAVDFKNIVADFLIIATLIILGTLTKYWGGGIGARMAGFDRLSGNVIGAGMISRGEMALITLQIGYAEHLLSAEYYSDIVIAIVVVTILAPFMLKWTIQKQRAEQGLKEN
ncbi:cation:proton antiporter [Pediococcus claussenii]|uniref:Proton antiporter-2 family protein n=1 Tax=Pediococcus claussenii (strain ATCC BAA-344 / DSM 14800 / JCM 18046 / KCTC 3811 / LMG 21948 / P06) TaxID=701521 RepID=G8PEE1_PEDCP|nr:cation:proton antiporter [Pediococcus claussenii]AEV94402.1 proton antiporter-2 family protein [Pediococcus claussenii ATCC BAA-344]ANZ69623.1 sodium:proton antiporter [Pediococcus claussenii]ANZ71440.1 sodium:proton antiporter [Pediococcus claussenii]KRN19894.1 hypothetical protein IV79_GL001183 [Pediococcus claussenii]